jgi:GNAT superfamily N-acetyltransferase
MPPSQTFRCSQLNASSVQDWLHLTSPLLRSYATAALASAGSDATRFLALALEDEAQERAALLLAEVIDWPTNNQAQAQRLCILSVVVAKPLRRQGIGRQLLAHAEHWAKTHHLAGLNLPVPLQSNSTNALLQLTSTDHGWTGTPGKVIVGLSVSAAVEALVQRLENVVSRQSQHASWQIAPFPEHQTTALQERISMAETGQLGSPWNPDDEDYQWQPADKYSRLLLNQEEIVGWLITHFVSPDCLRYAKFWVDPGWEHSGAPLAMLASVMRSAHFCGSTDRIPKGCFISHPENKRYHHWVKKLFRPVCESWIEIQEQSLIF